MGNTFATGLARGAGFIIAVVIVLLILKAAGVPLPF